MNKPISAPSIIHSEKGEGFHNFFKEQCKKVEFSQNKVRTAESPFLTNHNYWENYDAINWKSAGKTLTKML